MEIAGQIALITGGASGIGAETARFLSRLGAKVAILDRDIESAQSVANSLDALAIKCDVTQSDDVNQAFDQVEKKLGTPRICVNCAGVAPAKTIVSKDGIPMPLEEFNRIIQINLIGTFSVLSIAAARMTKLAPFNEDKERGVIICTASIAAFEGQIGQAAYSASKGGIISMILPAARELARFGIRVLAIAPGLIETPLLYGLSESVREGLFASIPYPKRFGKPIEYAKLAAHMIENTLLNGEVIRLDAGLRMR